MWACGRRLFIVKFYEFFLLLLGEGSKQFGLFLLYREECGRRPDERILLRKLSLSAYSLNHCDNGFNQEFKDCWDADEFRW